MAGPLVMRSGAPSSAATIIARVVLPSPGGPDSSTWSGGRPRAAWRASSTIESCSRTLPGRRTPSSVAWGAGPPRTRRPRRRPASTASAASRRVGVAVDCDPSSRGSCGRSAAQRPARSRTGDVRPSAASASGATAVDRVVGLAADQPRPDERLAQLVLATRAGAGRSDGAGGGAHGRPPSRSLSSRTMRCGALLADAGHLGQRRRGLRWRPRGARVGRCTASTAWASRGPTPAAVCSASKTSRSSSSTKPYRVSSSSRTTSAVDSAAELPRRAGRRAWPGCTAAASPTPPTSMTAASGPTAATVPQTLAIIGRASRTRPACGLPRAASSAGRAAPQMADRQGERVGGVGRRRARASSRSSRVTIVVDLRLVGAAAAGDGGLDLARGVQRDRQPAASAQQRSRRRRPGPCPSRCGRWPG